jgi:hypothetical protein
MTDESWTRLGPSHWQFSGNKPYTWRSDTADIYHHSKANWALYINGVRIASFNTWEEARDATPMMLKLHGYESQS